MNHVSMPLVYEILGHYILPLWTEMYQKYMGTDNCIFRWVVQDSIYYVLRRYWHDITIGSGPMTFFEQLKQH